MLDDIPPPDLSETPRPLVGALSARPPQVDGPRGPGPTGRWLPPGTPVDLTNCEREPIHVPGSIQPFGVLVAVSEPDLVVRQVSDNLAALIGTPWHEALGRPLADLLGSAAADAIAGSARALGDLRQRNPVEVWLYRAGSPLPCDVILHRAVHRVGTADDLHGAGTDRVAPFDALTADQPWVSTLVIELVPAHGPRPFDFASSYLGLRGTLDQLSRAVDVPQLFDVTVEAVRALTGFDRVMIYLFDADYNGEVAAEVRRPDLNSFLGLHYPASDIPPQARSLYEKNWVRLISDVDYVPAVLHPVDLPVTGRPLDLTHATLRSVSPIHCEYLRNMGVRGSMSISLLRDGKLWGLIACHHYAGPHAPSFATRLAAEFLGATLSMHWAERTDEEARRRADRVRVALASVSAVAADVELPLVGSLLGNLGLLDVVPADSVVVNLQGEFGSAGLPLSPDTVTAVARWAAGRPDDVVHSDRLPLIAPTLGVPADQACGVLVLPLPEGQFVLWARQEQVHSVDWGGDPHNKAIAAQEGTEVRLSPRLSFDRWRETVRGRSHPWTDVEVTQATELRTDLLEALYARSRRAARAALTLQLSLLTEPPEVDDRLEYAVRYSPAEGGAKVGGDWYDVFQQPGRDTVLAIGDVVGHDSEAAACMGQLRGLLRGIGYDSDDTPAGVLTRLDRAIAGLRVDAIATVLVVRLEQTAAARDRGEARLRWSSAGHLPGVVVHPDGTTQLLSAPRADLLLGVDPAAVRRDHELIVSLGSTLLLYTDGLVERRDQLFDIGIDLLRAELTSLRGLPVAEVADRVLARMLPAHPEDDVALVVVRLSHPGPAG